MRTCSYTGRAVQAGEPMTAQVRDRARALLASGAPHLPPPPGCDPQRQGLLPRHTPPPAGDTAPSSAHRSGSGPQVWGTLHLILERLRPTLVLSARQPRDEPDHAARPAHQRLINRREPARSQTSAPAYKTTQRAPRKRTTGTCVPISKTACKHGHKRMRPLRPRPFPEPRPETRSTRGRVHHDGKKCGRRHRASLILRQAQDEAPKIAPAALEPRPEPVEGRGRHGRATISS